MRQKKIDLSVIICFVLGLFNLSIFIYSDFDYIFNLIAAILCFGLSYSTYKTNLRLIKTQNKIAKTIKKIEDLINEKEKEYKCQK